MPAAVDHGLPTDLPPPEDPRAAVAALGRAPRKSLGQSFLVDRAAVDRIAAAAVPDASWSAFEIGAGTGALTRALALRAARVAAVEVDAALAGYASRRFGGAARVEIAHADARRIDYAALGLPRPFVVCGNLPYHLTGALLEAVLEARPRPDRVVFTVQLEVADRIAAAPGSRTSGALTVLTAAAWRTRRLFRLGRGAFHPSPKVDSAVVLFEPLDRPLCPAALHPAFRKVVLAAFSHRRKRLRNALIHAGYERSAVESLAEFPGVRLDDRPERHDVAAFVRIAERLG